MSQAAAQGESALTPAVKAVIGATAEKIEASFPWGIEREGLRIFTQAIMDPDPRYWDDEFAKKTKFGGIVTPPIYCTYIGRRTRPGAEDPITRAFEENPESDGIQGVRTPDTRGGLPDLPTPLVRTLNAGNEIEVRQYPKLGDRIFSQAKWADIRERVGKDGSRMLIVSIETIYTNQNDEVLCILRASSIRR
jgi:N-terminal half of MaoC dehydratase